MNVQDVIAASNYASASVIIGDTLTAINDSEGPYTLTRGEEDMPPREYVEKDELEDILSLLDEDERQALNWEPLQEAEA